MSWRIVAIDDYINQVSQFQIDIQNNIQQQWVNVAYEEDISVIKRTRCPQGHDYYNVIFQGLAFKFIIKIDDSNREIRLISCTELDFLKHGQVG